MAFTSRRSEWTLPPGALRPSASCEAFLDGDGECFRRPGMDRGVGDASLERCHREMERAQSRPQDEDAARRFRQAGQHRKGRCGCVGTPWSSSSQGHEPEVGPCRNAQCWEGPLEGSQRSRRSQVASTRRIFVDARGRNPPAAAGILRVAEFEERHLPVDVPPSPLRP